MIRLFLLSYSSRTLDLPIHSGICAGSMWCIGVAYTVCCLNANLGFFFTPRLPHAHDLNLLRNRTTPLFKRANCITPSLVTLHSFKIHLPSLCSTRQCLPANQVRCWGGMCLRCTRGGSNGVFAKNASNLIDAFFSWLHLISEAFLGFASASQDCVLDTLLDL